MGTIDLRRLRLRPGEVRDERVDVELQPFLLGGQRYELHPETVPVDVQITRASGATVFDLRLHAHLVGPCMRCLGFAELEVDSRAREFHDSGRAARATTCAPTTSPTTSCRVGDWARDVIALAVPEQILCREECAGLCPVLRQGPERRAARARRPPARSALGRAREPSRPALKCRWS